MENNMAAGKAKVRFIGGCLDGEHYDSFDTRDLKQQIVQFDGYWFGSKGNSVQLMKGDQIGDNWLNYSVDVYEKEPKGKDGYFIYRCIGKDSINRCTALTKKGSLCGHVAKVNTEFCPAHTKSESDEKVESTAILD
jgi:hypothetical protein